MRSSASKHISFILINALLIFAIAGRASAAIYEWGYNCCGQLGVGTGYKGYTAFSDITSIAAGELHTVALKSDGTVWAWGANYAGQLGDGSGNDTNISVQASGLSGVKAIACGSEHSVALKSDGTVWAWGDNSDGQLDELCGGSHRYTGYVVISSADGHHGRDILLPQRPPWHADVHDG